ncbi:kinase superfamily [Olea europaea subsp. europaea]|uniref:Kinase superfamily n=1 Tax=Olea europaea subsp. europaea TaxID=158383 RepID=A0A8S0SGV3_OLEEU|nr:kinase superfamily [Olea europaea subsp. europaea]
MEKNSDGFVRADQIDLKSLDEQLERHLSRARTTEKNKKNQEDFPMTAAAATTTTTIGGDGGASRRQRHEWEIDPSKLIIKGVIARGTFGTVHRGIYDGQDVAGYTYGIRDLWHGFGLDLEVTVMTWGGVFSKLSCEATGCLV